MEEQEQVAAPNETTKLQETSETKGPKKAQIYFTLSQLAVRSSDRSGPDRSVDRFIRDLTHSQLVYRTLL